MTTITSASNAVQASHVRFAHHRAEQAVLGIGESRPALSWRIDNTPAKWKQTQAQVEITRESKGPEGKRADKTQTVHTLDGANHVFVPWDDLGQPPLTSRERVTVRIRMTGAAADSVDAGVDTEWSAWSEPATAEVGLLTQTDWHGKSITPDAEVTREDPAPVLVRRFVVDAVDNAQSVNAQASASGRLHITAGGVFVAYIDGERIGNDELAPGWTEYNKRISSRTYDVSSLLTPGEHEIAILLGNGWYRGQLTWSCRTNVYGDRLWALADMEWSDNSGEHVLATDDTWHWRSSNILFNDLYDGQKTDLRQPLLGVDSTEAVQTVQVLPMPEADIVPAEAPAARIVQTLPAQQIITTPSGKTIVDFGQNIAGWVRMTVRHGSAGDIITLRHAEVLEHGELGTRPLRNAKATDEFIISGDDIEVLEPLLTQHGFRYVEVDAPANILAEFDLSDIEACVVSADMEPLTEFDCSNEDVNRLFLNTRWSTIDNFLTVPTDCPQRDERLGWTGDIAVFAPTATTLFDSAAFLNSWLDDMASDQGADGGIPVVVPDVLDGPKLTCGWGDASVIVPWAIYQASGDVNVLRRFLPMMDAFVDGVAAVCHGYLWKGGFQFGDWLDPDAPVDDPGKSKADPDIVATAYFAHSAGIVAQAHNIVGQAELAEHYAELTGKVAQAWRDEYTTANGAIISDCVTVYALGLTWDLLATDQQRDGAAQRLVDLVRTSGYRISTGFLGTPLICEALEKSGHGDIALRLLLQRRCPSWLYPVSMGATTIWERWDSMLPSGDINPGEMTSFNHYALGAITHWLITSVAGLKSEAPAWRTVRIRPVIGNGIDHAHVRQTTPYGVIDLSWHLKPDDTSAPNDRLTLSLTVPEGVTAFVELPGADSEIHCESGHYEWTSQIVRHERTLKEMSISDVIDSADLLDDLTHRLAASGSPVYANDTPDITFTHEAKQWLHASIDQLPTVASMQGFVPAADKIQTGTQEFLAAHTTK